MADLLLYEPHAGGHQAEFLTWLAKAWVERGTPGRLVVAAPAEITRDRPALIDACAAPGVALAEIEAAPAGGTAVSHALGVRRAKGIQRMLAAHDPSHVLLMNFEPLIAPLVARVRLPGRARVSALALRPTLHYGTFEATPAPLATRAKRWAKAQAVRAAVSHPRFDTLFSLDPTAVPALRVLCPSARVFGVPDPVPPDAVTLSRADIRARYGVEAGRHLMILPGTLDSRKGALVVAEALLRVPDPAARRLAVLFAGRIDPAIESAFRALLARATAETQVQVLLRDTFVPPDEIQAHVAAADTVLVLYNAEHVGSSGFLMRAAGAGVPVLCTADGLMGVLTRRHRLGQTTATDSASVARAIALALDESGLDPVAAAAFADTHSVESFTSALLSPLLAP